MASATRIAFMAAGSIGSDGGANRISVRLFSLRSLHTTICSSCASIMGTAFISLISFVSQSDESSALAVPRVLNVLTLMFSATITTRASTPRTEFFNLLNYSQAFDASEEFLLVVPLDKNRQEQLALWGLRLSY